MKTLTVSEAVLSVKNVLEKEIGHLLIQGEITNLTSSGAGHYYFSLADSESILSAALFRMDAYRNPSLKNLKSGDKVVCYGRINVYPKKGTFQLIVNRINPIGKGELKERFERLKLKLSREGLFDVDKKKAIPRFPKKIGLITSKEGAAVQDFLKVYKRRSLWGHVVVSPALVQGEKAPLSLRKALEKLIRYDFSLPENERFDAIILTRGGGSLEDLWAFNDEALAWDIFNCPIPIISAVGHEVDFTISDFVSDFRCETPSTAAELLSEGQTQIKRQLMYFSKSLLSVIESKMINLKRKTEKASPSAILREIWKLFNVYERRLQKFDLKNRPFELLKMYEKNQRLDELQNALEKGIEKEIVTKNNFLEKVFEMLRLLDPNNILGRGYTYLISNKKVVSNYSQFDTINRDEPLEIVFKDGRGKVKKS
ncbi:MAG: exodeoxyribonuclease VII large subunit [Halobacteriovoraceae bacterium]|nr:exodeoxyribonuclease VII large subunit [Halobacteriovoraceae bacterium]